MRGITVLVALVGSGFAAMSLIKPPSASAENLNQDAGGTVTGIPETSPQGDSSGISSDPATWPTGDRIWDCCRAVAQHEGYGNSSAAPFRYNNPGDLSKGDEHGQAVRGYVRLPDGENLINFSTAFDGWTAMYKKIRAIVNGSSFTYSGLSTLSQIGSKWATDPAWALGVAQSFADPSIVGVAIDPSNQGFYDYVNGNIGDAPITPAGDIQLS